MFFEFDLELHRGKEGDPLALYQKGKLLKSESIRVLLRIIQYPVNTTYNIKELQFVRYFIIKFLRAHMYIDGSRAISVSTVVKLSPNK